MISPFHGNNPPFELPSNIVYFHDWRYVHTGGYNWVSQTDEPVPMFTLDPVPPMKYVFRDIPLGIRLRAMPVTKSAPVFLPDQNNELALFGGNLIHENGKYRLWYDTWPREEFGKPHKGIFNFLKYAESDNGVDWKFPHLGVYEYNGSKNNNIAFGRTGSPVHGYHGGCVFKDPSAPLTERYKLFHFGLIAPEELEQFRKQRPEDVDYFQGKTAVYGGVSPDGFHWTHIPEPLVVQTSDTHNICEYDPVLKQYVAYCRSWYFHRRTIGRMATTDFRRFPLPEELIWPGPELAAHETWYANGKTKMPGTVDYHVMFPMRWGLVEDKFDFFMATSPDNINWHFVPGGPVCVPGDPGNWDGGVIAPGLGLVNLPDDRTGLLVAGSHVPHKHPRRPPLGALAWATWPKGRLVALQAQEQGSFALAGVKFHGRTMHLNFKTSLTGFVKVEVIAADGGSFPGRTFDDCDLMSGNHLDHIVTWKGQFDLTHKEGDAVAFRFNLRSAELFSVEFK